MTLLLYRSIAPTAPDRRHDDWISALAGVECLFIGGKEETVQTISQPTSSSELGNYPHNGGNGKADPELRLDPRSGTDRRKVPIPI